jgi:hypothetical protein
MQSLKLLYYRSRKYYILIAIVVAKAINEITFNPIFVTSWVRDVKFPITLLNSGLIIELIRKNKLN